MYTSDNQRSVHRGRPKDAIARALGVGNANDFEDGSIMNHLRDYNAPELSLLIQTRRYATTDTPVREFFREQKSVAHDPSEEEKAHWFKMMKVVLREIDQKTHFISENCPFTFLDIGCCPGGFSSYLLSKNPRAKGTGLSLDPLDGGHEFRLEDEYQTRLNLIYADVTRYDLGPELQDDSYLQPLHHEIGAKAFDIVLLDGHHLNTRSSLVSWDAERLLVSQLVIALLAVSPGGTLVIKLTRPENSTASRILYMLDHISGSLQLVKPLCIHQKRPTFYAVAKGIGYAPQGSANRDRYLAGLRGLWTTLTLGGKRDKGRPLQESDLDFIVTTSYVAENYIPRLSALAAEVWTVQQEALVRLLAKTAPREFEV